MAEVIAQGVLTAREIHKGSWAMSQWGQGAPTLLVENVDVAVSGFYKGGYGLLVSHDGATLEQMAVI